MTEQRKKPKNDFKQAFHTVKRLLAYIGTTNRAGVIIVLICIIASSLTGVAGTLFTRVLIDQYIAPLLLAQSPDFTGLRNVILGMAAIYAGGVCSTFVYTRLVAVIAQTTLKSIRDDMFAHLQRLPIRYFDTNQHGDVMSYFTNDTDTLRMLVTQSIPNIISSLTTITFTVVAMLYTSLHLSAFVSLTIGFILAIVRYLGGKAATHFIAMQRDIAITNGYAEEMLAGQKVVKVFCHEQASIERFNELSEALFQDAIKANIYSNVLMPTLMTLGSMQYVLVAIVGGLMAVAGVGGLSLGAIASFMQLSRSFIVPVGQMSQQINSIIMALAGAQRIFNLLDEPPDVDEGYITLVNVTEKDGVLTEADGPTGVWAWKCPGQDGAPAYVKLEGDVRFFDVNFAYTPDSPVLNDVSLFAKPGQKIALVGPTGAGKTTIANLLTRFYDVDEGRIEYDGIDIKRIKKEAIRHSLGVVLQDTALFTGTILENIRYGRLDATDEEVYVAARLANADGFIRMLPNGYETYLEEGAANLSQGQRQLISIARAAVANPPVMILDEATSSIDVRTEALVQKGMDTLVQNRTVFVIAHRLSTIRNARAILVIQGGRITERGDHDDLLAQKGTYYSLYTGDFELE